MRVLITSGIYPLAGSSIVIENLANKLCAAGVDVTVGALFFKRTPPSHHYNVAKLPIGNVFKLRRFLGTFDVIHNHHPLTNYLALLNNKSFIYHYHGVPDSRNGILHRINMLFSIKLTRSRLDAVIAVSEVAGAELKQQIRSDKIHVIYNGVDHNVFKPRLEEKFRKGVPQFLFVGNLYEHKNVEEILFALKLLSKEYPKAYLQIVGNGIMHDHLKNVVAKLGLEEHVELVGRVSGLDLPYYYSSCDVYVTASRWELFGLPLLEAMACGKPVVASSIPSHMELLTQSDAGETYPVGNVHSLSDKMIRVYEESKKYKENAIRFAKEHDWSTVAYNLLKIYDNLVRLQ